MTRNIHGDFIWYELMTGDAAAAERFYGAVTGWTVSEMGQGDYRLFSVGGMPFAGLLARPEFRAGSDMPPAWLGYVGVEDVDATVAAVLADGGRTYMGPQDIPDVGRFALLADPQGVPFYVMRGASDEASTSFDPSAAGHCNWNELAVPDPAKALEFWGRHFGWTGGDAMPMGEMGDYRFIDHAGRTIGAVLQTSQGRPPSFLFYFGVPDIDAAARAVTSGGGTVHHGPGPIPGGQFIVVATDPQGAWFGLVGPGGARE